MSFMLKFTAIFCLCIIVAPIPGQAANNSSAGNAQAVTTLHPQTLSKSFGQKGQWVFQGLSTSAYGINYKEPGESADNGFVALAGLRVGGMFKDRWLLGGAMKLGVGAGSGGGAAGKVGPFVGFYQPLGTKAGFLPTFELSYMFAAGFGSLLYDELLAQLSFDFVFHQAEHFALTFGPTISQTLFGYARRDAEDGHATALFYGVSLGMLGWK